MTRGAMGKSRPAIGGILGVALRRSWPRRATPWLAASVAACTGLFLACDSVTNPDDIVVTFDSDTTVAVGTIIVPQFTVTVNGTPAPQPRMALSTSDSSVISITPTNDSLFVNGRGYATITATLVGSTLSDDPPTGSRVLHAVAAAVHIAQSGVALEALGDTATCRAVALSATGDTIRNVQPTWFSANDAVASVNPSGRVIANSSGSTEVFAVVDYDTASVPVAVVQKLTGFTFNPAPVILHSLGATAQLTATPRDRGDNEIPSGVAPEAAWATADPSIATVTADGLVTAVSNGGTYVRASSLDVVDSVRTEVRQVAAKVSIFGSRQVTLDAIGDSIRLSATGFDALDTDVLITPPTWSSRNVGVVQVGASTGIARALDVGVTTIVARVDTAADSITVTVRNLPTSLRITPDTLRFVSLGDTTAVLGVIRNKFDAILTNVPIEWRIIDTTLATVRVNGSVVARTVGTTRLTGTLDNGVADTTVVVVENLPVTADIVPIEATLASVGDTLRLAAEIRNSRGASLAPSAVNWSSDDAQVVTTSSSGLLTAKGRGETLVRTTNPYNAAQRDSAFVQVTNAPAAIELNRSQDTLTAPTRTLNYEAVVRNARGATIPLAEEPVTWRSLDVSVATITAAGLATARAVGSTRIVAEVGTGAALRADTATLTVLNTAVSLTVSPTSAVISSVGDSLRLSAIPRNDVGGEVTNVQFSWTSSDPNVALVSTDGLVRSLSVGTTTITAALGALSASATIEVTNAPDVVNIVLNSHTFASINDSLTPDVVLLNALGDTLGRSAAEWLSDDALIAVVTSEGIIIATGSGTTRVRARNPLNYSKTDLIEVTVTNAPAAIELNRTVDSLPSLDRTLQYAATVWNARGNIISNAAVTWISRNTSIATITANGLARSQGIGAVYLVGTAGSVADSARLVVLNVASQVIVSPSPISLASTGATVSLSVRVLNELGNEIANPSVTWRSTNTAIATVSSGGLVTAVAPGSAFIEATVDAITTSISLTVTNHPATVQITQDAVTLASVGDEFLPDVDFRNAQGGPLARNAVTWSTGNPSVASVSSIGNITALARGTATITAANPVDPSISDFIAVTVTNAPATISLDRTNNTLTAYLETLSYTAEVRNASGNVITGAAVTWSSSNQSVATISQAGVATAVGRGTTTISAIANASPSLSATALLTVTNNAVSIATTPATAQILDLGGQYQLAAVALNNRGDALVEAGDVTWSSLDGGVATVASSTGLVTASASNTGTARIVAAAIGGVADTSIITVYNAPNTIAIVPAVDTLASIGETVTPAATILNASGASLPRTAVSWTSSAPTVATVSNGGVITAQGTGEATIRATSPYDAMKTDSIVITVTNAPASVELNASAATVTALRNTFTFTAIVKNAAGNTISGATINWSSTFIDTATISPAGVVTAQGVGVTRIFAKVASDTTVRDSALVTVTNPAQTVSIEPSTVSMTSIGEVDTVTAIALNSRGDTIVNPRVAWRQIPYASNIYAADTTITDNSLTLTATTVGTASLRATVDGVSRTVTVSVANNLDSVLFDSTSIALTSFGDTITVTGEFLNAEGGSVNRNVATWSSTNESVAMVSSYGVVTAVATGTARIAAVSPTNASANDTVQVTVTNAPASLVLSDATDSLTAPTQAIQYSAVVRNARGTVISGATVNWSSTAPSLVSVNSSGLITAVNYGSATIIATSGSVADTTVITVLNPSVLYADKSSTASYQFGTRKYPYKTIASAIAVAEANDWVVVVPTNTAYSENLTITQRVTLVGDSTNAGCNGVTCATPSALPTLVNNAGQPSIRTTSSVPLTVRYLNFEQNTVGAAIDATNATVTAAFVYLNHGATDAAQGSGIRLTNPGNGSSVRRSVINRTRGYGVRISGATNPVIEGVTVSRTESVNADSAGTGIEVVGGTGAQIDEDTVINTDGAAVLINGATGVSVDSVRVNPGGGNVSLGGGILLRNPGSGSSVTRSSVNRVRGYGVRIEGATSPPVSGVSVNDVDAVDADSVGAGIEIIGGSGSSISSLTSIMETAGPRVLVRSSQNIVFTGNTLQGRATLLEFATVTGTNSITSNTFDLDLVSGDDGAGSVADGRAALELRASTGVTISGSSIREDAGQNMDGIRIGDGSTVTVQNSDFTGGRWSIRADSSVINTTDLRFTDVVRAYVLNQGDTLTSVSDTVINSGEPCVVLAGTGNVASIDQASFTNCASDVGQTDAVFVSSAGASVSITNTSFEDMDRRIVNFAAGRALILENDTLIGNHTATATQAVVDVLAAANADTVIVKNSVVTDFPGRIGINVEADDTVHIGNNRIARDSIGVRLGAMAANSYSVKRNDIYDNMFAGAVNLPANDSLLANWWGDSLGPRRDTVALGSPLVGDSAGFISHTPAYSAVDHIAHSLVTTGAATIVKVRGDGQSAPENTILPLMLAVRVVDQSGRPVQGVTVRFTSSDAGHDFEPGTGGSEDDVTRTTDSSGIAKVPLEFDGTNGPHTITVSSSGLTSVYFVVTAT